MRLTALPLFPLQSVLFPDGWLPLRIFEVRYLDMIRSRHKADQPFGVVCLSEGSDTRRRASSGVDGKPPGVNGGQEPRLFGGEDAVLH